MAGWLAERILRKFPASSSILLVVLASSGLLLSPFALSHNTTSKPRTSPIFRPGPAKLPFFFRLICSENGSKIALTTLSRGFTAEDGQLSRLESDAGSGSGTTLNGSPGEAMLTCSAANALTFIFHDRCWRPLKGPTVSSNMSIASRDRLRFDIQSLLIMGGAVSNSSATFDHCRSLLSNRTGADMVGPIHALLAKIYSCKSGVVQAGRFFTVLSAKASFSTGSLQRLNATKDDVLPSTNLSRQTWNCSVAVNDLKVHLKHFSNQRSPPLTASRARSTLETFRKLLLELVELCRVVRRSISGVETACPGQGWLEEPEALFALTLVDEGVHLVELRAESVLGCLLFRRRLFNLARLIASLKTAVIVRGALTRDFAKTLPLTRSLYTHLAVASCHGLFPKEFDGMSCRSQAVCADSLAALTFAAQFAPSEEPAFAETLGLACDRGPCSGSCITVPRPNMTRCKPPELRLCPVADVLSCQAPLFVRTTNQAQSKFTFSPGALYAGFIRSLVMPPGHAAPPINESESFICAPTCSITRWSPFTGFAWLVEVIRRGQGVIFFVTFLTGSIVLSDAQNRKIMSMIYNRPLLLLSFTALFLQLTHPLEALWPRSWCQEDGSLVEDETLNVALLCRFSASMHVLAPFLVSVVFVFLGMMWHEIVKALGKMMLVDLSGQVRKEKFFFIFYLSGMFGGLAILTIVVRSGVHGNPMLKMCIRTEKVSSALGHSFSLFLSSGFAMFSFVRTRKMLRQNITKNQFPASRAKLMRIEKRQKILLRCCLAYVFVRALTVVLNFGLWADNYQIETLKTCNLSPMCKHRCNPDIGKLFRRHIFESLSHLINNGMHLLSFSWLLLRDIRKPPLVSRVIDGSYRYIIKCFPGSGRT